MIIIFRALPKERKKKKGQKKAQKNKKKKIKKEKKIKKINKKGNATTSFSTLVLPSSTLFFM